MAYSTGLSDAYCPWYIADVPLCLASLSQSVGQQGWCWPCTSFEGRSACQQTRSQPQCQDLPDDRRGIKCFILMSSNKIAHQGHTRCERCRPGQCTDLKRWCRASWISCFVASRPLRCLRQLGEEQLHRPRQQGQRHCPLGSARISSRFWPMRAIRQGPHLAGTSSAHSACCSVRSAVGDCSS